MGAYTFYVYQTQFTDSYSSYITKPARPAYERIVLYTSSMARYGKSPYIYPLYGLGELPQAFARLSAIYGGTYMLDKKIDEIVTDGDGKFVGVRSGDETVKAKQVIGDPSYFGASSESGKLRVVEDGKVIRAICILKHPIPGTDDADSVQIIIPQNQVHRQHGTRVIVLERRSGLIMHCFQTFISLRSPRLTMSARRTYMLPSSAQSSRPTTPSKKSSLVSSSSVPYMRSTRPFLPEFLQLTFALRFVSVSSIYTPIADGKEDNIFITRSYDATSHFETVVDDVHDVWKRIIGKEMVLKKREIEVQE